MNNVDRQYLDLLKRIIENGSLKHSRAGDTLSLFGETMKFDLKEGLPLLTTKKVFTKGIIHELLWFLSGSTNIKYLVDNNVHIWDDDAYRYYCELIDKHNSIIIKPTKHSFYRRAPLTKVSKEEFIELVKSGAEQWIVVSETAWLMSYTPNCFEFTYKFGDLGEIYGKQWRNYGGCGLDQIKNIIETLKTNPDDRRMLCIAYNNDSINSARGVALNPCHVMFQFYSRELTVMERLDWLCGHSNGEYDEWKSTTHEKMDELNVPQRELSCSFTMRSNDFCAGNPFNIASYAILTYMMCEVCNMVPGTLIFNGGDVHIYCNHIEQAKVQLERNGCDKLPILKFTRKINDIDDFKFEDFVIEGYEPDPPIKYQLNVG